MNISKATSIRHEEGIRYPRSSSKKTGQHRRIHQQSAEKESCLKISMLAVAIFLLIPVGLFVSLFDLNEDYQIVPRDAGESYRMLTYFQPFLEFVSKNC